MKTPIDLTNLRSMTDGDTDMETMLFKEFFSSFDAGIASLQASLGDSAADTWRKQTHALKGIALNLGAMELGEGCKKAQEAAHDTAEAKDELLRHIRAEYAQVRQFLENAAAA